MIIEYLRPSTIDEALQYLQRIEPITLPLGGGTVLSRKHRNDEIAVVDLQQVGLDTIEKTGDILSIGSASTLQTLVEQVDLHASMKLAITREININMRRMATVGGTIISADGCSPLLTALSAIDAKITWLPNNVEVLLGEWLPKRKNPKPGILIEKIAINLQVKLGIQFLARTPQDYPMASIAIGQWKSGRTRIVVGILRDEVPLLVLDGPTKSGAHEATEHMCKTLLVNHKHSSYLSSAIPEMVHRLTQEI